MDGFMILIMGSAVAFNFIVILIKLQRKRGLDALIDAAILGVVGTIMSGSTSLLMVGTVASFISSVYLWFSRPKIKDFMFKPEAERTSGRQVVEKTSKKISKFLYDEFHRTDTRRIK